MLENRKALLMGINRYPGPYALSYCVNDSEALERLLKRNDDTDTPNFSTDNLNNCESAVKAFNAIKKLFEDKEANTVLFYFSGHGFLDTNNNGQIVFPDNIEPKKSIYYGIKMDDIMKIVSRSQIKNKIVIMDCCNSGIIGNDGIDNNQVHLPDGCAIFTSCQSTEKSVETSETKHGVFTEMLLNALRGEAANDLGEITVGGIYAYIDRFMDVYEYEQRPVFKSNFSSFVSIRNVPPRMTKSRMRSGLNLFKTPDSCFQLSPEYEPTTYKIAEEANNSKCENFQILQELVKIGLVEPVGEEHMYYAAIHSKQCRLTNEGKIYWKLNDKNKI